MGFAFTYVKDALEALGVEDSVAWMKLLTPHPLPKKKVSDFIKEPRYAADR